MPRLVRLYVISVLIGLLLSILFTVLLLALDVGSLRHLVLGSPAGWLAGLMLVIFNTIVFAGVQFGIAVMALAESKPPRGGHRAPLTGLQPARAAEKASTGRAGRRDRAAIDGRNRPVRVQSAT